MTHSSKAILNKEGSVFALGCQQLDQLSEPLSNVTTTNIVGPKSPLKKIQNLILYQFLADITCRESNDLTLRSTSTRTYCEISGEAIQDVPRHESLHSCGTVI